MALGAGAVAGDIAYARLVVLYTGHAVALGGLLAGLCGGVAQQLVLRVAVGGVLMADLFRLLA